MRFMVLTPVVFVLVFLFGSLSAMEVQIPVSDGNLTAQWYPTSSGRNEPPLILLHQLGKDGTSWDSLLTRLIQSKFQVLVVDLRGHGKSMIGGKGYKEFTATDWPKMEEDLQPIRDWVVKQPNVDPMFIGWVGASIGANLAIIAAGKFGDRVVVALSPGLDYHGIKPLEMAKQFKGFLFWIIVSNDDPYSVESSLAISKVAGPKAAFDRFNGLGHGTNMLVKQRLLGDIANRLSSSLR